jgi:dethiobiotin synthase
MSVKKLYIAATGQNRGKTTLSLGLVHAFQKRGLRVGFIKPVGQRYVELRGRLIDEDAVLVDSILHSGADLEDMSPVAVARGFTQEYIQGRTESREQLLGRIDEAMHRVQSGQDIVLVEGTGHAGVGAVFDLSNPEVARALGLKALIVSGGGIGKPIDEIVLNQALFRQYSVELLGVVINQVEAEKYPKVNPLVRSGLGRLGIAVLGVMPFVALLSYLSMELIVESMPGELIAGHGDLDRLIENTVVGAMTPRRALEYIRQGTLVITPGDREDMLLAVLGLAASERRRGWISGLILTAGVKPHGSVLRLITEAQIPTYLVGTDTYSAAAEIHDLLVKVRPRDQAKITEIFRLVADTVDVDGLLERL